MDYATTITITTTEPITEDTIGVVADTGAIVAAHPGGRTLEATATITADSPTAAAGHAIAELTAIAPGTVEAVEVLTADEQDRRLAQPAFPALVGVGEIAELLGVSRQRASTLQTHPHFPAPVAVLKAGPVWRRDDLTTFEASWDRKPGRARRAS